MLLRVSVQCIVLKMELLATHSCFMLISGTAIESLGSMQSFLRGRPSSFKSVEHAIEWRYAT